MFSCADILYAANLYSGNFFMQPCYIQLCFLCRYFRYRFVFILRHFHIREYFKHAGILYTNMFYIYVLNFSGVYSGIFYKCKNFYLQFRI